ncbi:hypothetical protein Poli38472_004780 [Pythium oligandrum]|uniref:Uncharacterized protein n=1 Tax=Pythium oligandrum TaxID=41045 RepID=A0A8K1CB43_PYTOL|nr:hypothetical protein Poli38472_004780 [Pythium oligandrum]|eukprot:TMW59711.1 hypothetical protein Poli38472_004780 [Pythium oligandrum]
MVSVRFFIACLSHLSRLWDQFQVELHGRFTIDKIEHMRNYVLHSSRFRSLLFGVLTPVPALAAMILIDCIPLAAPDEGTNRNYTFWIRLFIAARMILCASGYSASLYIGFPVPFTPPVGSVAALPAMVVLLVRLWQPILRGNVILQHILRHQVWVLVGQFSLIFVYPLYLFAFVSMNSMGQHVFILTLPVIKIILKNYFSRMLHELHDCKPAFIVFNVDLFNALSVANSLQTSQSLVNTLVVMLVDIGQMAVSMSDVRTVMREIRQLAPPNRVDGSLLDLCMEMASSPEVRSELVNRRTSAQTSIAAIHPINQPLGNDTVASAPTPPSPCWDDISQLPLSQRPHLVSCISKVLYMAEFILLIEFVEVTIPLLYGIYLGAMSYLPNQAYYPRLASLTADELSRSIVIVMHNAALEFVSFVVACWHLQRLLRVSGLRLVGFALESQRSLIQSSFLIWALHVTQQALIHAGVDFTLRFTWLRQKISQNL